MALGICFSLVFVWCRVDNFKSGNFLHCLCILLSLCALFLFVSISFVTNAVNIYKLIEVVIKNTSSNAFQQNYMCISIMKRKKCAAGKSQHIERSRIGCLALIFAGNFFQIDFEWTIKENVSLFWFIRFYGFYVNHLVHRLQSFAVDTQHFHFASDLAAW